MKKIFFIIIFILFFVNSAQAKELILNCLCTEEKLIDKKNKVRSTYMYERWELVISRKDKIIYFNQGGTIFTGTLKLYPEGKWGNNYWIISGARDAPADDNILRIPDTLEIDRISGKGLYELNRKEYTMFYFLENCTEKPKLLF